MFLFSIMFKATGFARPVGEVSRLGVGRRSLGRDGPEQFSQLKAQGELLLSVGWSHILNDSKEDLSL